MTIFIDSIDNDATEQASVVILGYQLPNNEGDEFEAALIVDGSAAISLPVPYEVSEERNPSGPMLYAATTTAIGYFYLYDGRIIYPYCKLGQNIPNGTWSQAVTDGSRYQLNIKGGNIISLTPH